MRRRIKVSNNLNKQIYDSERFHVKMALSENENKLKLSNGKERISMVVKNMKTNLNSFKDLLKVYRGI